MKVKITKLTGLSNARVRTASKEEYVSGVDNGLISLPVDYNVEGRLIFPIEVGKYVCVLRTKRNGHPATGMFQTSEVTEITETGFKTLNSEYIVTEIE